jgi:hypothetical protein
VGYGHYVEEMVHCGVYDREGKTPEDEVTQVIIRSRAQFGMFELDANDAIDLVTELLPQSR